MKSTKRVIVVLIMLLIVLIIDLGMSIHHLMSYEAQKESGNARWRQVEQRIITVEDKVRELDKEINK